FEVRELLGERRPRRLIEDIGLVHHAAAERGKDERNRRKDGEQKKGPEEQRQACAPARATASFPCLPRTPQSARTEPEAGSSFRLARGAHGATIRTSPAAGG